MNVGEGSFDSESVLGFGEIGTVDGSDDGTS